MFIKTGSPVPVTVTNTMDPEVVTGSTTGVFLQENHDNSRPLLPRIQKTKTITGKPEHSIEELSQLWGDPTQMSKAESPKIGELSSLFGDSTEVTISPPMTGACPISRSGYEPLKIKHVIQDEMRSTLVEPPELPKLPVIYTEAQPIPRGYEDRFTPESLQTVQEQFIITTQSSMVRNAAQNLEQSIIAKNKEIKVTEKSNAEHSDLTPSDETPNRPLKYDGVVSITKEDALNMVDELFGNSTVLDMVEGSEPLQEGVGIPLLNTAYFEKWECKIKTYDRDPLYPEMMILLNEQTKSSFNKLKTLYGEVSSATHQKIEEAEKTKRDEVARFDTQIQERIGGIGTASIEEILTSKIFDPLSIETVASSTNQMVTDLIIQPFLQATPPTLPMSLNVYQYLAGRTANRDLTPTTSLMVAALGLTGEAGEVADIVKKVAGHGHALDGALRVKLQKEIGDVMWYIAELCTQLDITMEETAYENVQKLKARYPEGFSSYRSINRVE